jgi:hypothetical protein
MLGARVASATVARKDTSRTGDQIKPVFQVVALPVVL